MRIALLFVSTLLLHGCSIKNREDQKLTTMHSPVILIGKNPLDLKKDDGYPNVTVKDSLGTVITFEGSPLAISLSSRNVGDTIK